MKGKGSLRKLAVLILNMLYSVRLFTLGLCTTEEVAGFLGGDELWGKQYLLFPPTCGLFHQVVIPQRFPVWVSALAQLPQPHVAGLNWCWVSQQAEALHVEGKEPVEAADTGPASSLGPGLEPGPDSALCW